jgi:hypothetical protein
MSSAPQSGTAAPDVSDSERVRNIEEEEEERPEVMGEGSEHDVCCDGLQNNGGQLEWWKCPHRGQASVPLDIVCYTAAGMCCMQAETRTRHGWGFQQGKAGQGRAGQGRTGTGRTSNRRSSSSSSEDDDDGDDADAGQTGSGNIY